MNKIEEVFKGLKKRDKKALVPYITAGDPDLSKTLEVLNFFAENGADIIELGVPFSDPMADGPVIQNAMDRALKSGTTLRKVLSTVKEFKRNHSTPVVLMGYYNPFWAYGIKKFAAAAKDAGVDGILTVDLPPEEAKDFAGLLGKEGIVSIFLATPVTGESRIPAIKKIAKGFVYFVSVTGVTGERTSLPEDTKEKIRVIKDKMRLPVVLGFGISGPAVIKEFLPYADGFVVGSAIVKRWEKDGLSEEFISFFRTLNNACYTKLLSKKYLSSD